MHDGEPFAEISTSPLGVPPGDETVTLTVTGSTRIRWIGIVTGYRGRRRDLLHLDLARGRRAEAVGREDQLVRTAAVADAQIVELSPAVSVGRNGFRSVKLAVALGETHGDLHSRLPPRRVPDASLT